MAEICPQLLDVNMLELSPFHKLEFGNNRHMRPIRTCVFKSILSQHLLLKQIIVFFSFQLLLL